MGSKREQESIFKHNNFIEHWRTERNLKEQIKEKRLEYLERHHQHYQELAEQLERRENESSVKINSRWIRRLKELREEINNIKEQNTTLKGFNTRYATRSAMWQDRFDDLLDILLCDNCIKEKDSVYQSGDDERAKAWSPSQCCICRIYTRFFED